MAKLMVVPGGADALPEAPYPPEILARGWSFDLDLPRIQQSDTWSLAALELRPWLLMLWATSWLNAPCGSYPNDDQVIAARIGMPLAMFRTHRDTLMRGWTLHRDGRLYHETVSEKVLRMIEMRSKDRQRMAQRRVSNQSLGQNVRMDSDGLRASPLGVRVESDSVRHSPSPSPSQKRKKTDASVFDGVHPNIGQVSGNLTVRWTCPPDVDPAAWADWLAVRRKKKAATSERALTSVLAKLEQARTMGINPSSLVEKSADHGWIDLYLPDGTHGSASRPVSQHAPQQSLGMWDTSGALDEAGRPVTNANKSQG